MDTQEAMPEYVLQPHAISRAMYRLSATARKIIAVGMAIIPPDLSSRIAVFSFNDFCQALGLERSGERYALIQDAILECIRADITIDTSKKWKTFTWVQCAEIDKETNLITIEFSAGLVEYLLELKKMYARIELRDLGKLQSLYAIRLYEMAKSYESLAGKNGNREKCWFFERSIAELRKILGVEDGIYPMTADFRRYVIEGPVKEINEAGLGLAVVLEYIKKGRTLAAVRFSCQKDVRLVKGRRKKSAEALSVSESDPREAQTREEKEQEHLKKRYPDEYVRLVEEERGKPRQGFHTDGTWEIHTTQQALKRLKEKYGIRR